MRRTTAESSTINTRMGRRPFIGLSKITPISTGPSSSVKTRRASAGSSGVPVPTASSGGPIVNCPAGSIRPTSDPHRMLASSPTSAAARPAAPSSSGSPRKFAASAAAVECGMATRTVPAWVPENAIEAE